MEKYQIKVLFVSFFYLKFILYLRLLDIHFQISLKLLFLFKCEINLMIICCSFQINDSHFLNDTDQMQSFFEIGKQKAIVVSY